MGPSSMFHFITSQVSERLSAHADSGPQQELLLMTRASLVASFPEPPRAVLLREYVEKVETRGFEVRASYAAVARPPRRLRRVPAPLVALPCCSCELAPRPESVRQVGRRPDDDPQGAR